VALLLYAKLQLRMTKMTPTMQATSENLSLQISLHQLLTLVLDCGLFFLLVHSWVRRPNPILCAYVKRDFHRWHCTIICKGLLRVVVLLWYADYVNRGRAVLRTSTISSLQSSGCLPQQRLALRLCRLCSSDLVQRTMCHPWQRSWRRQVLIDNNGLSSV